MTETRLYNYGETLSAGVAPNHMSIPPFLLECLSSRDSLAISANLVKSLKGIPLPNG